MKTFENQWIEVFRAGEHTDSSGRTMDWTGDDLKEITDQYNSKKHEAPVVVGHPKENAPAFGWVEALKTDGKVLYAKFKQLVPEFIQAVKQGLYKKRSISLYPDMTLRHIGFLGAVPPAVKGLADIKFNESNTITMEFDSMTQKEKEMNEIKELKEQLKLEQRKNRLAEFGEFVNNLHSEGRIVSELQNTIMELMEALHGVEEYSFSEGKAQPLDKFREYLKKQPKIVEFGEKAKNEQITNTIASEQLNILAMERVKDKSITFSEALSQVQCEYKELAARAATEI